jgi:hypothetical protein
MGVLTDADDKLRAWLRATAGGVDVVAGPPPDAPTHDGEAALGAYLLSVEPVPRVATPQLLEGRGLGFRLDPGPQAWRAAPRPRRSGLRSRARPAGIATRGRARGAGSTPLRTECAGQATSGARARDT